MRHAKTLSKLFAVAVGCSMASAGAAEMPRPNIVFILADDLGWSDTTLYGSSSLYETPNLERLAKRGMLFANAYAAHPTCSPTRAAILTGQHPARLGITQPHCHVPEVISKAFPNRKSNSTLKATDVVSVTRLDTRLPTLGKMLKKAGYDTAHFGKWHLGPEPYSPLEQGFDLDIPHFAGPGPVGGYFAPWNFPGFKECYPKEHIDDRITDDAIVWLKSRSPDRPFFLNFWLFSVHAPFQAKADEIDRFRQKIDTDLPQQSPTYAAMVSLMDDCVGRLLDTLDDLGLSDSTAIIFTSDNGGNMYDQADGVQPTSNRPLRGGKGTPYDGGLKVPCIIAWPGVTEPGSRTAEHIDSCDFYPTILNRLDISVPEDYPLDGANLTPVLQGGKTTRTEFLCYLPNAPQFIPDWLPPNASVFSKNWKLIRVFYNGNDGAHSYRLYNLKTDPGETNNLAGQYPEMVKTLDQKIGKFLQSRGVVTPVPNPNFSSKDYFPENIGVPGRDQKRFNVEGWVSQNTCDIESGKGTLKIISTGPDPIVFADHFKPLSGGPFTLTLRMKSNSMFPGTVYYNQPGPDTKVEFPVTHDGEWHEYNIDLPVSELTGLRLDPSVAPGLIEIDWVSLHAGPAEKRRWDFD
jgi:arylsulfatase A-like enzyme